MFPDSHGFVAVTVTSCIKDTCSNVIYPYLIDRYSNETATLTKHVTKYKHIRKCMVEFLRKFGNRGIKIARVNSIRITKSINLV